MNWLQKLSYSPTGYLDTQLLGNMLKRWEDIEGPRDEKREACRIEAAKIAMDNGHDLKPWSAINSTTCNKCGREIHLYNILSRSSSRMRGRALEQKCDDTSHDTSNDVWEYRMNAQME